MFEPEVAEPFTTCFRRILFERISSTTLFPFWAEDFKFLSFSLIELVHPAKSANASCAIFAFCCACNGKSAGFIFWKVRVNSANNQTWHFSSLKPKQRAGSGSRNPGKTSRKKLWFRYLTMSRVKRSEAFLNGYELLRLPENLICLMIVQLKRLEALSLWNICKFGAKTENLIFTVKMTEKS